VVRKSVRQDRNIRSRVAGSTEALDERPSIFIRDKTISSERMLHKDYYSRSSVGKKKSLVVGLKGLDAKTN
jgi:hypothetical protein